MRAAASVMTAVLLACGTDHRGFAPAPDAAPVDARFIVDNRVPLPEPRSDYADIVTPELIVEPGEEKMFCLHVQADRELALDTFVGLQGQMGHHIALYTTTAPKPHGTIEDCTSAEANRPLQWFVVTIGLPAGKAIRIPTGMHYVLQFHYINIGDDPMRVRDVGRIHLVDPATVTTWVSTLTAQSFALQLPPGASRKQWQCTLPADRELLAVFGHMHEQGARYELAIGVNPDTLSALHVVEPWTPALRDAPPLATFYAAPVPLAAGTILRTTCDWHNTLDRVIEYPEEMCLTFAYVGGSDELIQCLPDGE